MIERALAGLRKFTPALLALVIALVFVSLLASLLTLPPVAAGLAEEVGAAMPSTAAENRVTATLLDFRSYDTLLEIAVLLLAVLAARAVSRGEAAHFSDDDAILAFFGRTLLPVMILIAAYLLKAGLDSAGGAFQAGAVVAAAGVVLILSGRELPLGMDRWAVRAVLVAGLLVFLLVGCSGVFLGRAFLDYPENGAGTVMLMIETAVTLSVALCLLELFIAVLMRGDGETARHAGDEDR